MAATSGLDDYAFGIDEIDHQHRDLFDLIAKLEAAIPTAEAWVVMQQTLKDISYWVRVHFAVEESLMRLMRFPDLERHIALHVEFLQTISRLKKESLRKDIARDTSRFLNSWFHNHIDKDDRKYAEYYLARFRER